MNEFIQKLGFSLTFDTAIIGFLVVAAFLYGISVGRKRVIFVVVSTYIAYALFSVTPYLEKAGLDSTGSAFLNIGIFTGYVVLGYILLSGTGIAGLFHFTKMRGIRHWWQIFILSVLQIGLFVSIVLSLFPEKIDLKIAPLTELLFTKTLGLFIWFLLPVLFLGFLRKRKEKAGYSEI